MEPVIFKTENNNCYLYSPVEKSLLPIPSSLYDEISTFGDSNNKIWTTLKKRGYLTIYYDKFEGIVDEKSIRDALHNLSQIVFETTTFCNLRCEYCCYSEGYNTFDNRRLHHGHLKFETAKGILDYLSNLFQKAIPTTAPSEPFAISFYGGEPLMNFSVIQEIVEYSKRLCFKNKTIVFTMTTNATLLAKYADFLQENNFKLLISLDGDRPHDAYRKTINKLDSFDIVMSNLQYVKEKYPKWFSSFRFNSVFTNISNTEDIIEWFAKTFGKVPNFSPLHTPTMGAKDYDKIKKMLAKFEIPEKYRFKDELISQSPINKRIFEICKSLLQNNFDKEIDLLERKYTIPTGTCIPFTKRMFVSYDGQIHPCEKVNRDSPLGKINNDGSVSINCAQIANEFMSKLSAHKSVCQQCYLQMCCTKCMLCFNEGKCDDFTSKNKFASMLSQTISYIEKYPDVVSLLNDNIIVK